MSQHGESLKVGETVQSRPIYYRTETEDDCASIKEVFDESIHKPNWFLLNPNSIRTVADIGALIGSFTLWALEHWPKASIHAYEPDPDSYSILVKNIQAVDNGQRAKAFNLAVWNEDTNLQLHRHRDSPAFNSVVHKWTDDPVHKKVVYESSVKIKARSMGNVIRELGGSIDFLAIDCEGAEYDILYSLKREELKKIRYIFLEFHEFDGNPDRDRHKLSEFLRSAGFVTQIRPRGYGIDTRVGYIYAAQIKNGREILNAVFDNEENWFQTVENSRMEKEAKAVELQKELEERSVWALELNKTLKERDARIIELQKELEERSVWALELNKTLKERDARIKQSEQTLSRKNAEVEQLAKKLSILEAHNTTLRNNLALREKEVFDVRYSILFGIVKRICSFIDKAAPPNTSRAQIVRLIRSAIIIQRNQGTSLLFREATKKFLLQYNKKSQQSKTANAKSLAITELTKLNNVNLNAFQDNILSPQVMIPTEDKYLKEFLEFSSAKMLKEYPMVSIIIPTYDNLGDLTKCLYSIETKTTYPNYEIIIVTNNDDANSPMRRYLSTLKHHVYIYNGEYSFGGMNNFSASKTNGELLLFLNDDTEVYEPHWLEALVRLALYPSTGAVGGKIIYPNGTLQEAGAIVWGDGKSWNYGRSLFHQADPNVNFVREVDYCSASFLLVKKSVFNEVGGFDSRYFPAYWEDADLCFAIRDKGYSVLYQPLSTIIHKEGATQGTDTSKGIKAYQPINQKKFFEKWRHKIEGRSRPSHENALLERSRRIGKRILYIDHYVPTPDQDAGSLRTFYILGILSWLGHDITFWPDNLYKREPYVTELQQKGIEVIYGPNRFEDFLSKRKYFDIIILSRPHIAIKYIDTIHKLAPHCNILYDTTDLHFLRLYRQAIVENKAEIVNEAIRSKEDEMKLIQSSNVTFVVSRREAIMLKNEDSSINTVVLPNIHIPAKKIRDFENRRDMLFVGGFQHPPNVDAAIFLVKEVFPLIKERVKDVKLFIVGSNPPESVARLASEDVKVTGYVADINPYLQRCKVMVAPLRYGAGVKGKITYAMSFGLPVVSTTIGAEGIDIVDGESMLIGNTPEEFASKTAIIYGNRDLWNKISRNSYELAIKRYSPENIRDMLNTLIPNKRIEHAYIDVQEVMERDWDKRAKQNAKYFIKNDSLQQTDDEFFKSGQESVNELIVPLMDIICQGKNPQQMRVLEIGCGIGRMTMHMAKIFGEVYGVDVSGEMINIGKEKLKNVQNVSIHKNNGKDLSMFEDNKFDFCFSFIVFQHIPDKNIILSYIKEVSRVLKAGGVFLFQVHGSQDPNYLKRSKDTWCGVSFLPEEIWEIAKQNNFMILRENGQGTQYYWLIFVLHK